MGWRETIQRAGDASFRGVKFKTTDAEVQPGRRNVVHEYPERDRPFVEDMGKRAKQWHVEGYVIGENYLAMRDALIAALDARGPGELRHPRYGVLQVSVIGHASVKETNAQGGMARFSMQFVDSGTNVFPAASSDTVGAVDTAATRCDNAAQDHYVTAMNVSGPGAVLDSAFKAAKSTIDGLLNTVRSVTSLGGLSALVRTVGGLAGSVKALLRTPVVFAQQLRSTFTSLVAEVRRPLAALQELRSVFVGHARPAGTARPGSTAAKVLTNKRAHNDLIRALALSAQSRMLAVAISGAAPVTSTAAPGLQPDEVPVATSAQALALRDALLDQIDTELETTEPAPEMAAALQQLRAAVARDVSVRAELLRERSTYTPLAALPALVLAHRIYGDATRVDELVSRNGARNPNLVAAKPLEVLK